jgi:phosphocarrier protein HPr
MIVQTKEPMYANAAAKLIELTGRFQGSVYIKKGDRTADAKSFLGVIALSIYPGDKIEIMCDPPNTQFEEALLSSGLFSCCKH